MSNYPYSNFDTGGETDILNVTGIDNNILVKDSNGAITSTFLTNNEPRGSIDFADGINIVGLAHGTGLQVENNSVRIGKGNVASGTSSISIGLNAIASEVNTIAVGGGCSATQPLACSVGTNNNATQPLACAFGVNSSASAPNSFALGTGASAGGVNSISIGNATNNTGTEHSIAIGTLATNLNNITKSISVGYFSGCKSINGIAIGNTAEVAASDSIAIGYAAEVTALSNNGIAIGSSSVTAHSGAIVIGSGTSTRTGLFINPVSEKTPDTNYSNIHYDTSTFEMYRSQYQLGLLLNRDITTDTTLTDDDLNGRVIRITATTGITLTLPQCFDGANCVIINGSNHNHTLAKLSGNTLNYNQTTLSLQTSKRVHHVYGVLRSNGVITSRDWYVD